MHVHHPSLPNYLEGAALQDGCKTCERRAESIAAMLHLDRDNLARLWRVMVNASRDDGQLVATLAEHRAACELYYVAVLLERTTAIDPWGELPDLGRVLRLDNPTT